MGYRPTDNVVTVMSVEPLQMVDDHSALTAQGVLANFGSQMATSGNRPMFGPAQHVLIFGPAHANKVAQGGFDRKLIRRFIYEVYRIPVHQFPPESRERWSALKKTLYGANTMENATVPVVEDINDIFIMVHGGAGPELVLRARHQQPPLGDAQDRVRHARIRNLRACPPASRRESSVSWRALSRTASRSCRQRARA